MELSITENVENIIDTITNVVEKIPKKWNNILSIHVKTEKSTALPVYLQQTITTVDDTITV